MKTLNRYAYDRHQVNNMRMKELYANAKMRDTNVAIQAVSNSLSLALACLKNLNS